MVQNFVKGRIKGVIDPVLTALNIPHTRPSHLIRKWYERIDEDQLREDRVGLIANLTGKSSSEVEAFVEAYTNRPWEYINYETVRPYELYGLPPMDCVTLYAMIWALEPELCVETGAASGMASTMILSFLVTRENAKLYSLDLEHETKNEHYGMIIPEEYREKWFLKLQKVEPILPSLLAELKEIDFFLHDSLHTLEHMAWEYELAWNYIRPGGCLASHDIWFSTAFDSFRKKHSSEISKEAVIGNFGFLRKHDRVN